MKLSLAVFCLINQISAACDFNTDKGAFNINKTSKDLEKGSLSDITVTDRPNNTVRIQNVGSEKVFVELPLFEGKMDDEQVRCDFKTVYMTDRWSTVGFSSGKN